LAEKEVNPETIRVLPKQIDLILHFSTKPIFAEEIDDEWTIRKMIGFLFLGIARFNNLRSPLTIIQPSVWA